MPNHQPTPGAIVEMVIAAIAKGSTVYGACKAADICMPTYYLHLDKLNLRERHAEALKAQASARIHWAWECLKSATAFRDEGDNPSPQGVKAAMAILYSKGELTDTRHLQLEHSGNLNVAALSDVFSEAAKKLAEKPNG